MATDPIPAREQAFAAWLRAALRVVIPADGTAITRNDARLTVGDRDDAPRDMTTGDVLRGMQRMVDAGEIEEVPNQVPTWVRRRSPASTLDASEAMRGRAVAGLGKLERATVNCRMMLAGAVQEDVVQIERVASFAHRAAVAEAREEGYRAAVADLLGAVPA